MGQAASESDVRVRWQELLEAEKILMTDLGSIPVFEKGSATLQNTKVKNLVIKPCNVLSFQYVEKNWIINKKHNSKKTIMLVVIYKFYHILWLLG